jgi:flagellar hook-associated protein 3 FlgL
MRVTPSMVNARVLHDLQQTLAALAREQARLGSGRRLLAPSDDPASAARSVTLRARRGAVAQFLANVAEARSRLGTADSTLRDVAEILTQARETAIQGANDTQDALARKSLAAKADQLLEGLLALALARDGRGDYLFGGQEVTRAPFTVARDPESGRITAVTPNPRGIDGERPVEVADGLTVASGVGGSAVFGGLAGSGTPHAFDVLIRLRDALEANDGAAVRDALGELAGALDRATLAATVVGGQLHALELAQARLEAEEGDLAANLSRAEDLDLAQAVIAFQQQQSAYEAALAAGARVLPLSLLDFLR